MKALVTGAGGQLGQALAVTAPGDISATFLTHEQMDICKTESVSEAIARERPDVIINTAAYTAVDKAETEKGKAFAVNDLGAGTIAAITKRHNIRLVHMSTDYVFDGEASEPYLPVSETRPINIYGSSKLAGEKKVLELTNGCALIVRTAWMFSQYSSNFVTRIIEKNRIKDTISVVDDQTGSPTLADDCAAAVWGLALNDSCRGICHAVNAGQASWYQLACEISSKLGFDPHNVRPIKTEASGAGAARPRYSVLDSRDTEALLGYKARSWQDALGDLLNRSAI